MPVLKNSDRIAFATYKARKRYRKDLELAGITVPGAVKQSSNKRVNKVPLSSSLKHNDQQLFKLLRLASEIEEEEEEKEAGQPNPEPSDEAPAGSRGQGSLRELVQNMERQAKRDSARREEQQERSMGWGDKEGGQKGAAEFEQLMSQAREFLTLTGGEPYEKGARPLGLKWMAIGMYRPKTGTEIKNEKLADALRQGKEVLLSQAQFDEIGVSDLQQDSFIFVDNKFFKPAATIRPSEVIGEVE